MCEENGLERPNYFTGQLLTEQDFSSEQSYFREKLRRHNRHLHGWGVVSGFEVKVRGGTVFIEPGVAIDCAGNEIDLCKPMRCAIPQRAGKLYVTVEYCETKTDLIPLPGDAGDGEGTAMQYSRIREGCQVDLAQADASANHQGMGAGTPGCGVQHPLSVARLDKVAKGWKVTPMGRRKRKPRADKPAA